LTTAQRLNVPETVQINHEPIVATGEPTVSWYDTCSLST
jgi:hypothetical protein